MIQLGLKSAYPRVQTDATRKHYGYVTLRIRCGAYICYESIKDVDLFCDELKLNFPVVNSSATFFEYTQLCKHNFVDRTVETYLEMPFVKTVYGRRGASLQPSL